MKQERTEIIFLLDRSGSMAGLESDTIGGFNAFLEKQRQLEGETIVTVVLFDDKYEILWNGVKADTVKLTEKEYFVRGLTALLDAVGKTILDVSYRLVRLKEEERPGKVIFVITTDGKENSSREFTYEKVKELIKQKQEKDGWEFIFLGANIDVAKEAKAMGIRDDYAYKFEASEAGIREMYNVVHSSVSELRGGQRENH
ncbi:MAG: VWA domain-containing protein [Firmicutes bacterium]|nr:VWA domain-containing protein [Bacillota bacterium]